MTLLIIVFLSIIGVFIIHFGVSLMLDLKIKDFYAFYVKSELDELLFGFFIAISLFLWILLFATMCAINNTFIHIPY